MLWHIDEKLFKDWSQSIYSMTVHKYGGNRSAADPGVTLQLILKLCLYLI